MTLHGMALLLVMLPPTDPMPIWDTTVAEYRALRDVAHLLELCDRDRGSWGSYHPDLHWCRHALRSTYDAPRLWHIGRLPPAPVVARSCLLARQHVEWLEHQQLLYPYRYWYPWVCAAKRCEHWWSMAVEATAPHGDLRAKRLALAGMAAVSGEQDWQAGNWPPPVPLQFYQSVK